MIVGAQEGSASEPMRFFPVLEVSLGFRVLGFQFQGFRVLKVWA